MAEQNFTQAIRIADRGYVIVHGKIAFEGRSADELNNNDLIRKFYLGHVSAATRRKTKTARDLLPRRCHLIATALARSLCAFSYG